MILVKNYLQYKLNDFDEVCVILSIHQDGSHSGFAYTDLNGKSHILHLEGYNQLKKEPLKAGYNWLELPLNNVQKDMLINSLERVYDRYGPMLPYDFENKAYFSGSNADLIYSEYDGFTCATFVARIFELSGTPIVKYDSWPKSNDLEWFIKIINIFRERKFKGDQHRFYKLKKFIAIARGISRYKPEEIVTAAAMNNHPHDYNSIKNNIDLVLAQCISC